MEETLAYWVYAVAGLLAIATYVGLPRDGRMSRAGLIFIVTAVALGGAGMLAAKLFADAAQNVFYIALSVLAIFAAVRVITHSRPVFSALYFLVVILSTAALLILCGAEFLAAALVIVYAGAILVTYVFVIKLAQQAVSPGTGVSAWVLDYDKSAREPLAAVLAGFVLVATIGGVIVSRDWSSGVATVAVLQAGVERPVTSVADQPGGESAASEAKGNTFQVGQALLLEDGFPVSLQVAGVLLLLAMIGAIALATKALPRPVEARKSLPPGEAGRRVKPF